jgi:hypothetical protein
MTAAKYRFQRSLLRKGGIKKAGSQRKKMNICGEKQKTQQHWRLRQNPQGTRRVARMESQGRSSGRER